MCIENEKKFNLEMVKKKNSFFFWAVSEQIASNGSRKTIRLELVLA